jgi:transcriptional regulator with XRE-family HTH domain
MAIRLRIKELAEARSLKQYQLAQRSGVTPQLVNRYWNNNIQRVAIHELGAIAAALGVSIGELFEGSVDISGINKDGPNGLKSVA